MKKEIIFKDKYDRKVVDGDVIELHQTVNGRSEFYIENLKNLDVRYNFDRSIKYEYDVIELLSPSKITFETEYEIINPF